MDFKKKMMKLLAPYIGTKQNKEEIVNLLESKIDENKGGGKSDEGIAIFEINRKGNKISLKLLQGKPKYKEEQYSTLQAIFIDYYGGDDWNVEIYEDSFWILEYSPYFSYNGVITNDIHIFEGSHNISFEDLNVGDTVELSNYITTNVCNFIEGKISSLNNSIAFTGDMTKIPTSMFKQCVFYKSKTVEGDVSAAFIGKLIKFDEFDTNSSSNPHYFYIEVDDEILKYTYTYENNRNFVTNITFVEVVQS